MKKQNPPKEKAPKKPVYKYEAKTKNQQKYLNLIDTKKIIIISGPAGSGKSFLALGRALDLLYTKKQKGGVKRIVLMRPAVEMIGEKLGALPGTMNEKIAPYMYPLYDNLNQFVDKGVASKLLENEKIHAFPLAFVRGSTIRSSFVIVDEAQNTIPSQIKSILTRLDDDSKIVINGDLEQTDIKHQNGLEDAILRLGGIKEVGIIHLTEDDIMRSKLIKQIIKAYRKTAIK